MAEQSEHQVNRSTEDVEADRRESLRHEVLAAATDPDDVAEMRQVLAEMEDDPGSPRAY